MTDDELKSSATARR